MKRLLALLALCLPLYLFAQGFGSFSHDQPFLAKDSIAGGGGTTVPTNNLVAYWRFDEITNGFGTYYYNSAPWAGFNLYTPAGFPANIPTNQPGILGQSIYMEGASSLYVFCNDNEGVSWTTNKTITCWIYPTNCSAYGFVCSQINSGTDYAYSINVKYHQAEFAVGMEGGAQYPVVATSPTFITNGWNFIAAQILAGSNEIRVRCATNGVMGQWYTNTYVGTPHDSAGYFGVGGDNGIIALRGRTDEMTMWNTIVSDENITNIWNHVAPFN